MGFEGLGARLRARVRTPAFTALDGVAGAVLTAFVGLGVVWVLGAVALGSGGELRQAVQRSACCSSSTPCCRRRAGCSARSSGSIPSRASTGPRCASQAPAQGIVGDPQVDAAARERRQGAGQRVRARRRGLGLGGRRRARGDQRARRGRPGGHAGAGRRATSRAWTRRWSPSTRATTSRCCAWKGWTRRRSRSPPRRGRGPRARCSASPATVPTTSGRAAWARRARS